MNNNDILRRIRYTFDFNDAKMVELFALAGQEVSPEQVVNWLSREDAASFQSIYDIDLASFLNGLIVDKRGKREGPLPKPEKSLSNNIIFRKLKIALNLKDDDILQLFDLADFKISKHELSAIFRKPGQSQYRLCKDQFLRTFLNGLQKQYRG